MPCNRFDVAIIGGGPAGCSAALTLLNHTGLKVAIIERANPERKPGENVPPDIAVLLGYLGLDQEALRPHYQPAYGMAASWGNDHLIERSFLFGSGQPAWHLDRAQFERALRRAVVARGGEHIQASVRAVASLDGAWHLQLDCGDRRRVDSAAFLIDASGRAARFARTAGGRRSAGDGLVAGFRVFEIDTVRAGASARGGLIEAVSYGWWYSAALPDASFAVACFTDSDLMREMAANTSTGWKAMLARTRHTAERLRHSRPITGIEVRAAGSQVLQPAHGANWIAAGDAALAVDPLSSMGICLALTTGAHAARVAAAACQGARVEDCLYSDEIKRQFVDYLELRRRFYGQERRWSERPFWHRRNRLGAQDLRDAVRAA